MELAEGGDLFDKIEADEGVPEEVAHFYFRQLIAGIAYCHSKGVAHRDVKPENVLLDGSGNLKLADFGLAALFSDGRGNSRLCNTVCGSPPYIAPEVVTGKRSKKSDVLDRGYEPNIADIWSCGIVLFVLLVGNTPWDEPTRNSYEFNEYVEKEGRSTDELWQKIPSNVASLLRGTLKLDPKSRFTLDEIKAHPWYTQQNSYMSAAGTSVNQVGLATQMLEKLHIDFDADPTPSQRTRRSQQQDGMDMTMDISTDRSDPHPWARSLTQPETPVAETVMDWERPPRLAALEGISASQPLHPEGVLANLSAPLLDSLADDPSLSQFAPTPSVPLSRTQMARQFADIVPSHSLARFLSPLSFSLLLPMIASALHQLSVPVATPTARELDGSEGQAFIKVKTTDDRGQGLSGTIVVECMNEALLEVRFVKAKGDPLGWRRLFKRVTVLCKEGIYRPAG